MAQVMTNASVPSTLVKCLYLFFDLPDLESGSTCGQGSENNEAEFSPKERRRLLQKMFIQVRQVDLGLDWILEKKTFRFDRLEFSENRLKKACFYKVYTLVLTF